jgi:hypothetical protein
MRNTKQNTHLKFEDGCFVFVLSEESLIASPYNPNCNAYDYVKSQANCDICISNFWGYAAFKTHNRTIQLGIVHRGEAQ